jgi:hypothetical protein
MELIKELAQRVEKIEERNRLVETNKAWETSITRRLILLFLTYLAIGIYLNVINVSQPWLNAIVPSVGFMLSTLTLPFFKSFWQKYIFRKKITT